MAEIQKYLFIYPERPEIPADDEYILCRLDSQYNLTNAVEFANRILTHYLIDYIEDNAIYSINSPHFKIIECGNNIFQIRDKLNDNGDVIKIVYEIKINDILHRNIRDYVNAEHQELPMHEYRLDFMNGELDIGEWVFIHRPYRVPMMMGEF